ncbi:helix-turn-helix transcriptional regulator [Bacillus infantis]|jgi:HTH-type transcriptional regulator, quorum sensing regulator NprR|uniref:helix-turn-helix transcriptional regulator n=1 Tax=Bacillus infantis TaxID=324767 RepID=UPI001CD43F01|nr:helix-turn-helix transcriptional regulator [Bacillus infantis]MCA1033501.1 helix-turn-helix transcriptional regulator [Bacillus infantis]
MKIELDYSSPSRIAKLIAFKRISLNITQEELANGICSIPYLSKLENNKLEQPNKDTIHLLLEKLNVNLSSLENTQLEIQELIANIFIFINKKKDQEVEVCWSKLEKLITATEDSFLAPYYLLIKLRYSLFKKDVKNAKLNKQELDKFRKVFTPDQTFYYYYFTGLFYSLDKNLEAGISFFEKAISFNLSENLKLDKSYLIYHLALAHSLNKSAALALQYSKEALELFQNEMEFMRVIDCHILIGINYTRTKQYQKALNHYNNILKLSLQLKDDSLIPKVHHNIGYLYSRQNISDMAIEHYKKSLHSRKEQDDNYLNTIYYLSKEYLKIDELQLAKYLLEDGIRISLGKNKEINHNFVKLKMLFLSIEDHSEDYLNFINDSAIPYYKDKNDLTNLVECYKIMGDIYYDLKQYKNSSIYYKLTIENSKEN